jgi:hypothetical protein
MVSRPKTAYSPQNPIGDTPETDNENKRESGGGCKTFQHFEPEWASGRGGNLEDKAAQKKP